MLDEVRRWATSAGMRRFHLGGGYSDGEDSLFRFKEKFSKKRVRFSSWRAVANQEVYRRAMNRYVPDGSLESYHGFFPAYRRGLKEGQVGEAKA